MSSVDQQLGVKDEVTYGTPLTVDRFFEFEGGSDIKEGYGRTEGDPLRVGTYFKRSDRWTPYFDGAAGTLNMAVLSKGFGWWLKHMLGASATSAVVDSVYTHTGTVADLYGKSFTCQITRPFHPSGTVQAFTYSGGKVGKWSIANSVDGNLMLNLDVDFQTVSTAIGTATAAYPATSEPLTWAGGVLTVGGAAYDVTEFACECDNGLDVGRKQIRANTLKKEPTGGRRSGSFSMSADFESLTQRNRAYSATRDGAQAALVGTWTAPTLAGVSAYPQLVVTVPVGRFDTFEAANAGPQGIVQALSGDIRYDGAASGVTIAFKSTDAVA